MNIEEYLQMDPSGRVAKVIATPHRADTFSPQIYSDLVGILDSLSKEARLLVLPQKG